MRVRVEALAPRGDVEVVERKGPGHPDTLADALAEAFSVALSRFYRDRLGRILHHNVDKALLVGGSSMPRYGGGVVTAPVGIILAGRATLASGGVRVPVDDLGHAAVEAVLAERMRFLRPQDVRVEVRVRPGSGDLHAVFDGPALANDTSIGVGFAPATPLEQRVLDIDAELARARPTRPWIGEDTKLMGVRVGDEVELTAAIAFVDRFLRDGQDYLARKAELAAGMVVNAADTPESPYLTVTGTSLEAGDDGQVGRGNRVGGLITPMRPMTTEAAAGKNPVTHVGKLYSVVARRAAQALVDEGALEAEVVLVSRIGQPIASPWLVGVRTRVPLPPRRAEEIVRASLQDLPSITERLLLGEIALW